MQEFDLNNIKNWSVEIESQITEQWKKEERYKFNKNTKKKIYSIDTPPPYINAPIHIGQAITYCYMDFFARYRRMKGFEVIFPLGLDRNGIPIEMAAEKKFNASPFQIGREKFIELCEKLLQQTSTETIDTFTKLGISFTSYREGNHIGAVYHTDSSEYRAITQATFIELYKQGLVYEDTRINNWDPKLQTTVADFEIEYKDIPSMFNDVKWKVKETNEEITIGTTRPELICTCGMVIYHPEDKRYKHLRGKTAITPLFNKEVPIKPHPLARMDKGTGLVMMCSAGDLSDIQFFREMKIKPVIVINKDGRMNKKAGFLNNLKVKEARQKIMDELKKNNLLIKQTQIYHRTPISERSGAEIEFIEMPEFYLKQIEFKKEIKKIAEKINFYPPEAKKILFDWIDSISIDWPISRRRFYATPIPLWHSENKIALPKAGKYYVPWRELPSNNAEIFENGKKIGVIEDFPNEKWKGEERVLDTWMDSSISELVIFKYASDKVFFKKMYPASLRPQGKEIIRTWLYYTILRGYLETKKPAFKDVWINQHIVDEKGRKMSKSVGNIIDPQELLKEYGAEAIRLWASLEGDLAKQDLKCSKDKIRAELKTLNKLFNITKFISHFQKPSKRPKILSLDQLFIDHIEELTYFADKNYSNYNFYLSALKLREFLWKTFASHYLEVVKNRAYNQEKKFTEEESDSAKYTLHHLLERLATIFHPIIPQITSVITNALKISLEEFPQAKKGKSDPTLIQKIMEFNSSIWKTKKEKGLGLRDPISNIEIPKNLKPFEKDLIACHNLK